MTWTLIVTDLKQYTYCPRILYFNRCLPAVRPITEKMAEGKRAQEDEQSREVRRQLRTYGFSSGQRRFDVALYSSSLGVSAVVDLVILQPDGQGVAIPVDYKLSEMAGEHFKLQLACYGLLVEEEMGLPAPYGFIYLMPERRAQKVVISARDREHIKIALAEMREIVEAERMPAMTTRPARCINCEFRRFCNDVF